MKHMLSYKVESRSSETVAEWSSAGSDWRFDATAKSAKRRGKIADSSELMWRKYSEGRMRHFSRRR